MGRDVFDMMPRGGPSSEPRAGLKRRPPWAFWLGTLLLVPFAPALLSALSEAPARATLAAVTLVALALVRGAAGGGRAAAAATGHPGPAARNRPIAEESCT